MGIYRCALSAPSVAEAVRRVELDAGLMGRIGTEVTEGPGHKTQPDLGPLCRQADGAHLTRNPPVRPNKGLKA